MPKKKYYQKKVWARKTNSLTVKISDDELYWYKEFAKARGLKLAAFIRKAVLEYMKDHPEDGYEPKMENAA